jgi:hypothetical protein
MSTERLGRLTSTLQKEVADKRLPGAVVMVGHGLWRADAQRAGA